MFNVCSENIFAKLVLFLVSPAVAAVGLCVVVLLGLSTICYPCFLIFWACGGGTSGNIPTPRELLKGSRKASMILLVPLSTLEGIVKSRHPFARYGCLASKP